MWVYKPANFKCHLPYTSCTDSVPYQHTPTSIFQSALGSHGGSSGQVHAKHAGPHLDNFILVKFEQSLRCQYSSGFFSCCLAKFVLAVFLWAVIFSLNTICRGWLHEMSLRVISHWNTSFDREFAGEDRTTYNFKLKIELCVTSFFEYDHYIYCYGSYEVCYSLWPLAQSCPCMLLYNKMIVRCYNFESFNISVMSPDVHSIPIYCSYFTRRNNYINTEILCY